MTPQQIQNLADQLDSCAECRLEIGGIAKFRTLSDDELIFISECLRQVLKLVEMTQS